MWNCAVDGRSGRIYWFQGAETKWETPEGGEGVMVEEGGTQKPLGMVSGDVLGRVGMALGLGESDVGMESICKALNGVQVSDSVRVEGGKLVLRVEERDGWILGDGCVGGGEYGRFGEVELFLEGGGGKEVGRPDLVSVCAFVMDRGYRNPSKYAAGVRRLCAAVLEFLPTFRLRVYLDDTLSERHLRGVRDKWGSEWLEVLEELRRSEHVEIVRFRCSRFHNVGGVGHVDLFGTLVRFLALFDAPEGEAGFVGGGEGKVWVTDADFSDSSEERAFLHLARLSRDAELVAGAQGASTAPRHIPCLGMPPVIANCVLTTRRFPSVWMLEFLRDAARGPTHSNLAGPYSRAVHDPAHRANRGYARRRIAEQSSAFPFGIDEYFLTVLLGSRASVRPESYPWLFVSFVPPFRIISAAMDLVQQSLQPPTPPPPSSTPYLSAILHACSLAATDAPYTGPEPPTPKDCSRLRSEWATAAAARAGIRDGHPFPGGSIPQLSAPHGSQLLNVCRSVVEAIAAGALVHTPRDLEFQQQFLRTLKSPRAKGTVRADLYTVGAGTALLATDQTLAQDILHQLSLISDPMLPTCGQKRPRPPE